MIKIGMPSFIESWSYRWKVGATVSARFPAWCRLERLGLELHALWCYFTEDYGWLAPGHNSRHGLLASRYRALYTGLELKGNQFESEFHCGLMTKPDDFYLLFIFRHASSIFHNNIINASILIIMPTQFELSVKYLRIVCQATFSHHYRKCRPQYRTPPLPKMRVSRSASKYWDEQAASAPPFSPTTPWRVPGHRRRCDVAPPRLRWHVDKCYWLFHADSRMLLLYIILATPHGD